MASQNVRPTALRRFFRTSTYLMYAFAPEKSPHPHEEARAVFKVSASGETTIFADTSDGLLSPEGITFHRGKIYVTDSEARVIYRYDQQGNGERFLTFSRKYRRLAGITFDEQDAMYVIAADPYSST